MSFFERAIAAISPGWAFSREQYRMKLDLAERAYEGAKRNRRTIGWRTPGSSANSEVIPALPILRNRCRDLCRNNVYAKRGIAILVGAMVGTGVQAKFAAEKDAQLFAQWCKYADADGINDFAGLLELIERTRRESGECLVRFRVRRASDGYDVPLQLQVLEPDHLDISKNETVQGGGYIMAGVQFNAIGQRVGYWIFAQHPGEVNVSLRVARTESQFVPASEIIHYFRRDRPSQVRGVPDLAASMMRLRDLDDYEDAELVRKKIEACFSVFVTNTQSTVQAYAGDAVNNARAVDKLSPGMVARLSPGEDVSFASPSSNAGYDPYVKNQLRAIAAGIGVTYEQMTCDLSGVNYSSIRAGLLEFKKMIERDQWKLMVPSLLDPIMERWVTIAAIAGKRVRPAMEWTMPKFELTDPLKEILAEKEAVRAGFKSLPEVIRGLGSDPMTVFKEASETKKLLEGFGLTVDTDAAVSEGLLKLATQNDAGQRNFELEQMKEREFMECLKQMLES